MAAQSNTDNATRVLGIDPGLQLTGYGLVRLAPGDAAAILDPTLVEAGVIRLPANKPMSERLNQLHRELTELIDEFTPTRLAVEKLYAHYRHPRTAILMGHARGVILLAAAQRQIPIIDLPSTEVKKAVTGYGHASKQQMQRAVQSQCKLAEMPSPPDVADAIAIALCDARRTALEKL